MIFKFTNDIGLEEADKKRKIKKSKTFSNKIVFVNGFSASGKTMLSPIVSSMQNVESMIYPYEIEWISSFLYNQKIDPDSYKEFIKQYADHTIYNQMMSRNSNFRFTDVSSVYNSGKFLKYLLRAFKKGDNHIPKIINEKKPITCFVSSHLIFFINAISDALKKRLLFIETVRDPVYMFKQVSILYKEVYIDNPEKVFTFQCFSNNGKSLFFDYYSKENVFADADNVNTNEFVVSYLERIFSFYFNFDFDKITLNENSFIFLPFEKFVVNPDPWIDRILKILKIEKTNQLLKEMKKQKIPRKLLNQGFTRSVYKRYGNQSISDKNAKKMTYEDADLEYKNNISNNFKNGLDDEFYIRLIDLSDKYREWIKKLDNKFIFD